MPEELTMERLIEEAKRLIAEGKLFPGETRTALSKNNCADELAFMNKAMKGREPATVCDEQPTCD